jgi:hypothetical protein
VPTTAPIPANRLRPAARAIPSRNLPATTSSSTRQAIPSAPRSAAGDSDRLLLVEDGLIIEVDERPDPESDDERRRYYRLTRLGREAAQAEADRLTTLLRQARAAGLTPRRSTS